MATNMAMGQRPANSFDRKLVGIVDIVTGDTYARLTLTEENKKFKNGSNVLKVALGDLPKVPRIKPNTKEAKQYRVRMSSDGTEVEAIQPVKGIFKARLTDIGPRPEKDADPMPREKVFGEGTPKESRHLEFFAIYQITEGAYKGVQEPAYNLHYKFEADPDNEGYTRFAGNFDNTKATRLFQLRDWGLAHNLWTEPIPWDDDTILPVLLERALEADVEVTLVVKNGYINEVIVDDAEENPFGEPEEGIEDVQDKIHSAGKQFVDTRSAEVDAMLDAPVTKSNGKVSKVTKPKKVAKAKVVVVDEESDNL